MVIADLCDGCHELVGHDVRCVAAPAKAGLQHDQITLFAGKPEERQRSDGLKLHRLLAALGLDGVNRVEHLLRQVCQRAGRDHLAVDLKPLTEVHHIRADGQTGLVARCRQDGGRHGRKTALAVRARNVDALQLLSGFPRWSHRFCIRARPGAPCPMRGRACRASIACWVVILRPPHSYPRRVRGGSAVPRGHGGRRGGPAAHARGGAAPRSRRAERGSPA